MLDLYFTKPETLDHIQTSWLGDPIERYVKWLHEQGYAARTIQRRVPVLTQFGEYTRTQGINAWEALPAYVDAFIDHYIESHGVDRTHKEALVDRRNFVRTPVRQLLWLILPDYDWKRRRKWQPPFADQAPGYLDYLHHERGLSSITTKTMMHHIRRFEGYLQRIELDHLSALSPAVISAFMTDCGKDLSKRTVQLVGRHLRSFLDYLHDQQITPRNLKPAVELPTCYRLCEVPRAISWDEVNRLLESVDRRTATGKRDYAIMLLLVTYGLRAREVAALSLDDIDWEQSRLRVPDRKAGHFTAYPLSTLVGEALIDYLKQGRPPQVEARNVFFRAQVPYRAMEREPISQMVGRRLRRAGIQIPRAGSHTLRHTCVQRLIDGQFDLKQIGDYVGHRSPASTAIYTKINVAALREIALGDGEDVL